MALVLGRRATLLGALAAAGWLGSARTARAQGSPARALLVVWLAGGPSQRETFEPGPGDPQIATAAPGVRLAKGFEALAAHMEGVALVRSLVSHEADHERGTTLGKTGYAPGGAVVHPSLGAIACHALGESTGGLPSHVTIAPGRWPPRGGMLGARFDAFAVPDARAPVPDLLPRVDPERLARRLDDAAAIDAGLSPAHRAIAARQAELTAQARAISTSPEVRAFDVSEEPAAVRARYGEGRFGSACLAARRLIERGVRAVEVTLDGWDAHVACREAHRGLVATLDPALAALLEDLRARGLAQSTLVVCAGEFGRTPTLNGAGGRDHWTRGFSALVAGAGVRGGAVVGATDPAGVAPPKDPCTVADLHATVLHALGVDPAHREVAPSGRPVTYSEGTPIRAILT
jgi:hypothetical protein